MTRNRSTVHRVIVVAAVISLLAPARAGAGAIWGPATYAAFGTSSVRCMWTRAGVDAHDGVMDFRAVTVLLQDVFCANFDLGTARNTASARVTMWRTNPPKVCGWTNWLRNSAGGPVAEAWATAPVTTIKKCGGSTDHAVGEHWAYRYGWRYAMSQSPSLTSA